MTTSGKSGIAFAPADRGAVCAIDGDRELTWSELDDLTNRFSSSLERLGVRAGDAVAIRLHTRLEWLVVSLGIAKTGAVAVAVNYELSPPEATYILKDCGVRAAIVDDGDPSPLVTAWEGLNLAAIVSLDKPWEGTHYYQDLLDQGSPETRSATDFAPIIIYSSGTTGSPKGTPLGGFQNTPDPTTLAEYGLSVHFDGAAAGPDCCLLMNLPMHRGAGPSYTRSSLVSGGKVVFQRRFDPNEVLRLIDLHKVTHWIAVPTMLQRVLYIPKEVRATFDTSSMKFIMGGAAPFSQQLKEQVINQFGDVLHEIYGCTEAGMMTGATPADLRERPTSSGRPFRHVDLMIVDAEGTELPRGTTGEIVARTPTVISGYIGRAPLGPGSLLPGGYYRTGDVGHLDEDGYLYIYDRITDMMIAGGVTFSPAEIEAVLDSHPDVALSAVVGVPHVELGEQPVAFIQRRSGSSVTAEDLLSFCDGQLAKYKWPRAFHFTDRIPVSAMGKLLKRAIREEIQ
ncbi:class I adenylate-forming enzyme family protein [Gordonia alkanivorans]|uniref:Putative fatty-acid--CoA ligase n=1 Tax=Gordonia alkanivorans NBRC 16433 TaxID=1027371 RepID=F9VRS2_9ACTN|nr:class I adenylate-forming enzyme family protein [Gordonia alkanivorans]GAA11311.1 putative fatty-acid--CoA ligase [Gordonia alkanivorans NBRC 16433]